MRVLRTRQPLNHARSWLRVAVPVSSYNGNLEMSRGLRDKIEYAMLCINKFAKANEMTAQQACSYLYDFKGLQFLDSAYPVESTLSSRIVVEDLHSVCRRNGGVLP